ncbi:hypothetical protein R5R35_012724 [Gryllus longicercus]|uniref:FHF complex subunit HOOK-interacting protein C-terminal domain-containing protein n=1 Tax=Gryllus longicercus TaxID=2509291 RepID=A0AAN9ZAJ7_9ORTH
MSWIRNSPLRGSFGNRRRPSSNSPPKDCDPTACFNSFREHWLQTSAIIDRTQPPESFPIQDDVLAVVNHLDQMVTLLLLELRSTATSSPEFQSQHQCLDFLLCENLLERLFDWSVHTGRYCNLLRMEQLKLYELLACQARQQLLLHQPFLRPLLRLLASCLGEVFSTDVEDRLVVLLNQLCVCLMHNTELLQLFFHADAPDQGPARFIIFSLLIPFVHREGAVGQQARDALLLCMTLSKQHEGVGRYIAQESNVCLVLATGLSGLYSRLPRKLPVQTDDWHRLTPDDVKDIEELATFMNSLEFCNAVAQVAHPEVRHQLLDFLTQGFLVPVLGPALLQDSLGLSLERLDSPAEASTNEELVAATAYLELCVRSVTEPGLLRVFVRFLLRDCYDDTRILHQLVLRIHSRTRLGLVSLALFDSLVALCCEDVMLELVFRHLVPCTHVMLSQRRRVRDVDAYGRSADKFLSLAPACCLLQASASAPATSPSPAPASVPPTLNHNHHHRRSVSDHQLSSLPGCLYGLRVTESLYGNYHAYLCDARHRVATAAAACRRWAYRYDGEDPPHDTVPSPSLGGGSAFASVVVNGPSTPAPAPAPPLPNGTAPAPTASGAVSLSESSGYESLVAGARRGSGDSASAADAAPAPAAEAPKDAPKVSSEEAAKELAPTPLAPTSGLVTFVPIAPVPPTTTIAATEPSKRTTRESTYLNMFNANPDIGPFLDALLRRLELFHSNGLAVNLQLTGLISRLACFPQPLLHSFLLNQSLVFQPSIRSLFQHKADAFLARHDGVDELVLQAQDFLVSREERLTNARRHAQDASSSASSRRSTLTNDPFSRGEPKRRSFSSTLSSMLRRATQPALPAPVPIRESQLEHTGDSMRFFARKRTSSSSSNSNSSRSHLQHVVLQAVLLDEWLKELAAITQEQALAGETRDI